jgi:hypothetical protein
VRARRSGAGERAPEADATITSGARAQAAVAEVELVG